MEVQRGWYLGRAEQSCPAKLVVDFTPPLSLRAPMPHATPDKQSLELVEQLCTRVGMIMEDASIIALTNTREIVALRRRVTDLKCASDQIATLTSAAEALLRS